MSTIQECGLSFAFDMNDQKYSDCVIKSSDGQEFKLHRVILTRRSEYFKLNNNAEIAKFYNLPERSEILKNLFSFIYSGTIDENFADFKSLANAAKKYGIIELLKICAKKIKATLKVENAVELLIFASDLNAGMEKIILMFIAKNAKAVRKSEGWKLLDLENHKELKIKLLDILIYKDDDTECWKIIIDYPISHAHNHSKCSLVVKPSDTIAWVKKAFLKVKFNDPEMTRQSVDAYNFFAHDKELKDTDIVSNVMKNYDTITAKFPVDINEQSPKSPIKKLKIMKVRAGSNTWIWA